MYSKKNQIENSNLSAIMVIFGGTGDLTHRKLMPALYNLVLDGLLPDNFKVVSIGRRDKTQEEYISEVYASIDKHSRNKIKEGFWNILADRIHYYRFDFRDKEGYVKLKTYLSELDKKSHTNNNLIFYLAVAPEYFETIISGIQYSNMAENVDGWSRLVIEKPFGRNLVSARALNRKLLEVFDERDIYRIDHYLGKDMIQNIMVLRFTNSVFESIWNNKYIDNIQISLTETHGVRNRGDYYEHSGAMRDMLQNHIMQILSLVAMEPPVNLDMDSIRTEKVKVIQAIEDISQKYLQENIVCGQYGKGIINGVEVPGYRKEINVSSKSNTETFIALKLQINNFRWSGTPFYIRTGKRLEKNSAEIVIQFKNVPNILYFKDKNIQEPNLLVIRIQPKVGVFFQFNTKDFTTHNEIMTTKMDTSYITRNQGNTPEAYERLIYDILRGDGTLFSRWDEVEAAWMVVDHLIKHREYSNVQFPNYDSGSMGPTRSQELLEKDGRKWWNI